MNQKVQHWGVDVRINGERVLTIESNCLSGIDNIMDYRDTVIEAANNLLGFIGPANPEPFFPHEQSINPDDCDHDFDNCKGVDVCTICEYKKQSSERE